MSPFFILLQNNNLILRFSVIFVLNRRVKLLIIIANYWCNTIYEYTEIPNKRKLWREALGCSVLSQPPSYSGPWPNGISVQVCCSNLYNRLENKCCLRVYEPLKWTLMRRCLLIFIKFRFINYKNWKLCRWKPSTTTFDMNLNTSFRIFTIV